MKTMFTDPYKLVKMAAVLVCALALSMLAAPRVHAQLDDYNPYLIQGIVDETGDSSGSTLIPAEFGGTGFVRFDVGNKGSTDLPVPAPGNPNDVMTLVVTLSKGVPNVTDPNDPTDALNALSGPGLAFFDWTYDPAITTYYATQIATIPGGTRENVTITYKVTENSFLNSSPTTSNGFRVELQPPGYTNPQPTDDDGVSSYTYVEASDFGDNPTSGTAPNGSGTNNYGSADHTINLAKNNGSYVQYMYLGTSVDPEDANQASGIADGDDTNQSNGLNPSDDEDGVTFPAMVPGEQDVTIPVVVTIEDANGSNFGFLNAWIDWNGDGDFGDASEQIASNQIAFASGTINLSFDVPLGAVLDAWTFARFRFGNPAGSTGNSLYGEVEDYPVPIGSPPPLSVSLSYAYAERDADGVVHFEWETATETSNAGFNLYMAVDGDLIPVNGDMIPSDVIDSVVPVAYSYDAEVAGEVYYIEMVSLDGPRQPFGPYNLGEKHGSSQVSAGDMKNSLFLPVIVGQ